MRKQKRATLNLWGPNMSVRIGLFILALRLTAPAESTAQEPRELRAGETAD